MPNPDLTSTLEAILFTASEPLGIARLATLTGDTAGNVETTLKALGKRLTGGIRLSHNAGTYRLVTAPETAGVVRSFLEDTSRQDLSRPALETLAIIAYRGPITKSRIEQIRGVASEAMLRNLLARGLITEGGRSPEPGRPQAYVISHAFLQHFGLTSTKELPPLPEDPDEN
jgi:segregation and condensation protein B